MVLHDKDIIARALALRKKGNTYTEISRALRVRISKSTLSYWCRNVNISPAYRPRIQEVIRKAGNRGRKLALLSLKTKRNKYLNSVRERVIHLTKSIKNIDTAKISLAMLYLGEGSKNKSSLVFGNSNPEVIALFLKLLRYCYNMDERKFRCTVQCRADQNIKELEKFWATVTKISSKQFSKAQVDPRTIGKPSKKPNYKGVCRIDYFSADIFLELKIIAKIVTDSLTMGR